MSFRRPLVALFAVAALASGACSDDDRGVQRDTAKQATTSAKPAAPALRWNVDGVYANATNPPSGDITAAVHATLDTYLAVAIVAPLHSGAPAADLSAVLSPAALERVTSDPAARATLVDEGLPPMTTSIAAERARATLSSVAGPDGQPAVVGAQLDLVIRATGPTLDIDIVRQGEVVLVPEAGGWRIDSFVLTTKRDSRP